MGRAVMITEASGNLLDADVDALVNTVNTVGIMGKGIALQFKRAYPEMFKEYARACSNGSVQLERMHVWATGALTGPRYIVNFPTKGHWRSRSRIADIDKGLDALIALVVERDIVSLALPPLGCGQGGLAWSDVQPLIWAKLSVLPALDVLVFPPAGSPPATAMRTAEPRPAMTPGRAAMVTLMASYATHALAMPSLVETQKVMYFLQEAGEPLGLQFIKHVYGPYADNLRHVLRAVEGHFISGFGGGSSPVLEAEPLTVQPGALEQAEPIVRAHPETERRIQRVLALAEDFESSYGLELLATVHWVAAHQPEIEDPQNLVVAVQCWSARKGRLFQPQHILTAWRALQDRGWLRAPVPA